MSLYKYFGGSPPASAPPTRGSTVSSSSESEDDQEKAQSSSAAVPEKRKKMALPSTWKRWTAKHAWIRWDPNTNGVKCQRCKDAGLKNQWTRDSGKRPKKTGWRLEYFDKHAQSHDVKQVAAIEAGRIEMERAQATALKKANPGMKILMKNILFCVQHERPISFASDLHQLTTEHMKTSGAEITVPDMHKSNFSTYQFLQAMDRVVTSNDVEELQNARVLGIQIDESTDIQFTKTLMIYTRHFSSTDGCVLRFRAARPLLSFDAAAITTSVLEYFDSVSTDLRAKLVYFTSDGASTMLGSHNGVAARLRRALRNNSIVAFHCVCHREALALKDSYTSIEFFVQFENDVRSLLNFIHTSKVSSQLEELANAVGAHSTKVPKLFDVRWLSRYEVMEKLAKCIPLLQVYFADLSSRAITGKGFLRLVKDRQFLLTLFYVVDVLEPLARLNKTFQQTGFHPFDIPDLVQGKIEYISESMLWP